MSFARAAARLLRIAEGVQADRENGQRAAQKKLNGAGGLATFANSARAASRPVLLRLRDAENAIR